MNNTNKFSLELILTMHKWHGLISSIKKTNIKRENVIVQFKLYVRYHLRNIIVMFRRFCKKRQNLLDASGMRRIRLFGEKYGMGLAEREIRLIHS